MSFESEEIGKRKKGDQDLDTNTCEGFMKRFETYVYKETRKLGFKHKLRRLDTPFNMTKLERDYYNLTKNYFDSPLSKPIKPFLKCENNTCGFEDKGGFTKCYNDTGKDSSFYTSKEMIM